MQLIDLLEKPFLKVDLNTNYIDGDKLIKEIERSKKMAINYMDYWTSTPHVIPKSTSHYTDGKTVLEFMGQEYLVDYYEVTSDGELTLEANKIYNPVGHTGAYLGYKIQNDRIQSLSWCRDPKDKYRIKKIICNLAKSATTVIFKDGSVEVVKKSPEDPEADIFSVVAYALAEHMYGSNSAFKKEVAKNLDFIDKGFEKMLKNSTDKELAEALISAANIANALRKENKENEED